MQSDMGVAPKKNSLMLVRKINLGVEIKKV